MTPEEETIDEPLEHGDDQPDTTDTDSAIGDTSTIQTETETLSSSIFDYRVENGRTYHAFHDGAYWGPNDERANEHLDLAHALFTRTFGGKLFLAPVPKTATEVLDLGTGTGIWAIDFADEFPATMVLGTDLSPIQPDWVPPNCKFEIDDFTDEWTFGEDRFDYIHMRTLHASVPDWSVLYGRCMRALKPGGYLEQAEYSPQFTSEDDSIAPDSAIAHSNRVARDAPVLLNIEELNIFENMKGHFVRAGFEDVVEKQFRWPLGPWPQDERLKELGYWARVHVELGLENWVLRLLTSLGWSVEEITVMCAGVRRQVNTPGVHALQRMNVVYGRKPKV